MDSKIQLDTDLQKNIDQIQNAFVNTEDLTVRKFDMICKDAHVNLAIIFLKVLVNCDRLDSLSLQINQAVTSSALKKMETLEMCFEQLKKLLLCESDKVQGTEYEVLYEEILAGNTIVLLDGLDCFFSLCTFGPQCRSISEPTSQTIIRGPKEGFTEMININISQVRRRVRDKSLKVENMTIGTVTKTKVSLMYLNQIAKDNIVEELKSRLKKIKTDAILESGYIEALIRDDPYTVFPIFLNSEKPDSVAANLLQGKIAIFVDGTPFVLTAPAAFIDFMQVSEDYYHHFFIASLTRIFRFASLLLTMLVPATYIALTTFHQEMIPTALLISIAAQREGVPFPAFVEAVFMEITFEILREAGIRMPRAIGPAISIVGALVLGQAAVEAGIISAVIVIVVSITAISSFAIPNYAMSNAIRILRFILMILSACLGLYGIYIGLIALLLHLCKLKSLGVPYLTPVAPQIKGENKDILLRFPLWTLKRRPKETSKTKGPRIMKQPVSSGVEKDRELS